MDIWLINTEEQTTHLRPSTILGMLWLQTHFEDEYWEALATNQVKLPTEDARTLYEHAIEAGLSLNFLPALSTSEKF